MIQDVMRNTSDIRWQQRFQNFERALLFLERALATPQPNPLEEAGIVQAYEFTFELAWKTLKDYLEAQGVPTQFPRDVLKEGFAAHLLENGEVWFDMLEKRNLMAHTYNETSAQLALSLIRGGYTQQLRAVYDLLRAFLEKT
jgi:nucleotidyltransferase substrate binding protein (TIGR01987 family)